MKHDILPNGDLRIIASESDRTILAEMKAEQGDAFDSDQIMGDVFENLLANSELSWSDALAIGALTSAPVLAIFGETREEKSSDTDEFGNYVGCRFVGCWPNDAKKLVHWVDPLIQGWAFMNYQLRSPQDDLLETGETIFQIGYKA